MAVPYTFSNATGNISLTELDSNFAAVDAGVATAVTAGSVTNNSQPNITSVGTLSALAVTGVASATTIRAANYQYGNGAPINLAGTYSNANVQSYLPVYNGSMNSVNSITAQSVTASTMVSTGSISATNTITGGNLSTGGRLNVTGPATVANLTTSGTVTASSITATSALSVLNATVTGQITVAGAVTAGSVTTGAVNSNANVTAQNIVANSRVEGQTFIVGAGGIVTNAPITGAGSINLTGTIQGGQIATAGTVTATGNITGGNVLATGYYYANGQPFSGGGGGGGNYGDANVAAFIATATGPLSGSTLTLTQSAAIGQGITAASLVTTGNVRANGIVANNYQANANVYVGGRFEAVGAAVVGSLTTNGNVTGGNIIGNGATLTNVLKSNTTRTVYVSNAAPTSGQGSVGDIWYQTY